MRIGEGVGRPRPRSGALRRVGAAARDEAIAERLALDERHHVVEEARGLAGIVQRQDVRVRQAGRDLDLALKALEADGGTKVGSEHLDGDATPMPEVGGHVNGGHAALAELTLDDIAIRDCGAEALEEVSHRSGDECIPRTERTKVQVGATVGC